MLVVAGSPYQKQLPRPFSKIKGCIFDSILRIHICQSKKNTPRINVIICQLNRQIKFQILTILCSLNFNIIQAIQSNRINTSASHVVNLKQENKMVDQLKPFNEGGSCMSFEDAGSSEYENIREQFLALHHALQ